MKLTRNRSTKALRAWWDAVLKAAASAPKLTVDNKKAAMTEEDEEEQRRSFAFGNANIDNEQVTRQTVDEAAETLQRGNPNEPGF